MTKTMTRISSRHCQISTLPFNPPQWVAFALLSVASVIAAKASALAASYPSPLVPDPTLTPGDVLTTDTTVVCQRGYTATVRDVPQSLKNQVFRQYGITHPQPREYEIDHLISLELGGSNSIRNLWPQSYRTMPLNATVKDRLENRLHALVCGREAIVASGAAGHCH